MRRLLRYTKRSSNDRKPARHRPLRLFVQPPDELIWCVGNEVIGDPQKKVHTVLLRHGIDEWRDRTPVHAQRFEMCMDAVMHHEVAERIGEPAHLLRVMRHEAEKTGNGLQSHFDLLRIIRDGRGRYDFVPLRMLGARTCEDQ